MGSDRTDSAPKPRVVILGGGFAGVGTARKLKDADVDVVVVDQHNYHTFQPLLYQVATDLLEPSTVGHPPCAISSTTSPTPPSTRPTVTGVDLARRRCASRMWRP